MSDIVVLHLLPQCHYILYSTTSTGIREVKILQVTGLIKIQQIGSYRCVAGSLFATRNSQLATNQQPILDDAVKRTKKTHTITSRYLKPPNG